MLPSSSLRLHQTLTSPILSRPAPLPPITMRDRSKNRKPLQKGRNLSIEAIQAAQALKRASADHASLQRVLQSNVRRLIKFDMMALLAELQRQNRAALAFQFLKCFATSGEEIDGHRYGIGRRIKPCKEHL